MLLSVAFKKKGAKAPPSNESMAMIFVSYFKAIRIAETVFTTIKTKPKIEEDKTGKCPKSDKK